MGVGIFSECVFFLKVNSLPSKEKANLKTSITSNGGAISFAINEKCTHVVAVSNGALNSSQQKNIQKHCIPVVKPDFIWRSIQENRLVEVGLCDSRALEVKQDQIKDDKKARFLAKFLKQSKSDTGERDFIDAEEFEEEGDEEELPFDTEVAKYSFFQKGEEIAIVEILCFSEQCPFPFKVSTVCGIPGTSQKEFSFNLFTSSEKACNKYQQRLNDLKNKGFTQIDKIEPEAELMASQPLQKVLLGEALNVTQLSPEVGWFVESIWTEAQGHLTSVLSCPVENISLNDVSKAEGILQNVRNALNKNEDIRELMEEFYQCIPHWKRQQRNVDKKFLTAKQDLCQLIRDMVNSSETNAKPHPSSVGKYRALKCRVEYVDPNTEEFHRVKQEVLNNNHSNEEFQIFRVFRVGRLTEASNFRSDLGNVKSLLHASSLRNIVGILSRGLLLPKIIVDEFGLDRTDIGNLGSGIYFSDSISTSVKYTEASRVSGERLLLVCDVALGKTKDVGNRDYSITEPPEGFHSLHGVRSDVWKNSQFIDDEFVVYNVNQVKIRYGVQFCTSKDTPNLRSELAVTLLEENEQMITCEPTEDDPVEDLPEAKVPKGGLQSKDGQQVPLESIHVKARLKDLAAQVIIFQTYKNNSLFPIEAKYVFPLDETAAVCGFEAFINGKHIVGEVKEKQQAHREYRTAISQGHGAYLMDQDAPDVFTVSVGNLPAKATVIIKVTYIMELKCSYSSVSFSIPGTVASWQEDQALKENTQDIVARVGIEGDKAAQGNFCLDMSVEMPRKIEAIYSYTHSIKKKQTECKAVIQVEEGSTLTDGGFCLNIDIEDLYIPRMWVETHPDQDSEACLLIFQPEFEDWCEEPTFTIFLDCSNSMESCFQSAKQVALLALNTVYASATNIIVFGSTYKELYLYPNRADNSEMEKFIKMAKPNMGSTEFWKPLQSTCLLKPTSGPQKILLISDGHLQNENIAFQILKKNKNHIKLFTCGVGAKANKHMLRRLAKDGAGAFEFFADTSKGNWRSQMEKHDSKLRSAACTAISIKWRLFGTNPVEPMQAPASIPSLYHDDNLFVYGFVPHCTQATLKALINDKEFENIVSTTELQKTTGTILHKLAARAFIRDYEDGILHEQEHENEMEKQKMKSFIIKLSKEHSIVTQFTSFVAVEKRSAEESENVEPNILEILSAEDVDVLPYMAYEDKESAEANENVEPNILENPLAEDVDMLQCMAYEDMERSSMMPDTDEEGSRMTEDEESSEEDGMGLFGVISSPHLEGARRSTLVPASMMNADLDSKKQSKELSLILTEPHALGYSRHTSFGSSAPHAEEFRMSSQKFSGITLLGKKQGPPTRDLIPEPPLDSPIPQEMEKEIEKVQHIAGFAFGSSTASLHAMSGPHRASEPHSRRLFRSPNLTFNGQRSSFLDLDYIYGSEPEDTSPLCGSSPAFGFRSVMSSDPLRETTTEAFPHPGIFGHSLQRPFNSAEESEADRRSEEKLPSTLAQLDSIQRPTVGQAANIQSPPLLCAPPAPPPSLARIQIRQLMRSQAPALYEPLNMKPKSMRLFKSRDFGVPKQKCSELADLSWSSFSLLQCPEGCWMLTPQLGKLLNIDVSYFCDSFLHEKGISSLGSRGKEEVMKLIATLLVLQTIRTYNLLTGITFKTLMKLDQCDTASKSYPGIEKAVNWAAITDRQYSGICSRLGLGRDWEHATRQLLGLESPSSDLSPALYH
ncbi:protein mono-ADP-ribosyltransferase PARP4 isoform X2 [Aquarana catesbeiana]|uniref:protein mono-ADP-ribosyltransferase PARP4 isoform X2 n=1 Tax=Aquarana catesbeiana TaxID=8400 RepID=UPI003CCA5DBF